ncbi:recombination activating protein 1-like [Strongylocentrotus purpuratus]|uniref:V(D)J recombination-activating protein 1 n=1 Tax=Strongylocentrotus purpuratus TaxID=7668 RepID=Q45ZT6_STRPU|nr:recombination activating 1 [Strongylocentrotus purpuratus]AAZ23546.1 recombination activating protein 1-like [Strongylocentrotus purpuratus]|eukprot:NP_001028179.1 recombination activating protein 1-like [Strongylocentrotus purpuratus]
MEIVELHRKALSQTCRVCGSYVKNKKSLSSKEKYEELILSVYGIDFKLDDEDVHPPRICVSCRLWMTRSDSRNAEGPTYPTSGKTLANFSAHPELEPCSICEAYQATKSTKRKAVGTDGLPPPKIPSAAVSGTDEQQASCSFTAPSPPTARIYQPIKPQTRSDSRNAEGPTYHLCSVCAATTLTKEKAVGTDDLPPPEIPSAAVSGLDEQQASCSFTAPLPPTATAPLTPTATAPLTPTATAPLTPTATAPLTPTATAPLTPTATALLTPTATASLTPTATAPLPPTATALLTPTATRYRPIVTKDRAPFTRALFSPVLTVPARKSPARAKGSLHYVRRDCAKNRARGALDFMTSHSAAKNENETDLWFFGLHNRLRNEEDERAKMVMELWTERKKSTDLSVDDCLAMRVGTLCTKGMYAEKYSFLKSKGDKTFRPPGQLTKRESCYMPGNVRFGLMEGGKCVYHTPEKSLEEFDDHSMYEPIRINVRSKLTEFALPNCIGVAWSYPEAVAKTLEELDENIREGMLKVGLNPDGPSIIIDTTLKDGADGMGEIAVHKMKSDTFLPDKAFRASFVVLKCEVKRDDGTRDLVFEEPKPNSVIVNRPLLEAIGDENSASTSAVLMRKMEKERLILQNSIMTIHAGTYTRLHRFTIYNSMIDEKLARSSGGLQGSGSNFICTLCHATKTSAKTQLGSFKIDRTLTETQQTLTYITTNPDNLTPDELTTEAGGVKRKPLLTSEPKQQLMDATHADIDLGQFFKKIIVREMAGVHKWEASENVKQYIVDAERRLNINVRELLGTAPSLMMPGNYARALFKEKNEDVFLELIRNEERKELLRSVLQKFRALRKIYREHHPNKREVQGFKKKAVQIGRELLEHFEYVCWPNYLHKIFEHTQEAMLSEDGPGSIGILSSEGSEAANKLFRKLRNNFSRRGDVLDGLRDILWFHWLYTSPKLVRLRAVTRGTYTCSRCGAEGHNKKSCNVKAT